MSDARLADSGFRLTGRHVLLMLLAFFGVVFAVNAYMMRVAVKTFSGLERASPYRDGLRYNTELADAKRQASLGWTVDATVARDAEGRVRIAVAGADVKGMALSGVAAKAVLERPADRKADRAADLVDAGAGRFVAQLDDVNPGQWDLVLDLYRDEERVFRSRSRIVLH